MKSRPRARESASSGKPDKAPFSRTIILNVAEQVVRSAPTAEYRAQKLAEILTGIAQRLADPDLPAVDRKRLTCHVDRLWIFELAGLSGSTSNIEIVTLVRGIRDAAEQRKREGDCGTLYCNVALIQLHMLFPERLRRFTRDALSLLNDVIIAWHQRGRGAEKWRLIERVARSIGIPSSAPQIKRAWADAQPERRMRKKGGNTTTD